MELRVEQWGQRPGQQWTEQRAELSVELRAGLPPVRPLPLNYRPCTVTQLAHNTVVMTRPSSPLNCHFQYRLMEGKSR